MTPIRILLLSATRPSRARKIAERLSNEMSGFAICGVVQQSLRRLPWIQQRIAMGDIGRTAPGGRGLFSKISRWAQSILCEVVHWFLWCAHGCPRGIPAQRSFIVEDLAAFCRRAGWPFLSAVDFGNENIPSFIRWQRPDLVIVLGEAPIVREWLYVSTLGAVRVVYDASESADDPIQEKILIKVERFAKCDNSPEVFATLNLPFQIKDGFFSKTLKCDLIADDLLLQTASCLGKGTQRGSAKDVKEWIERIFSPYLDQFRSKQADAPLEAPRRRRYRSIPRLSAQSLLYSPWVVGRNWYRRLRGRYPVLILTHHLVSDRPHRMGISTQEFWRQVRFLQRHYRIVSLSEACKLLSSGRVKEPTVVLTFDDGYCDNFVTLRAIAEETAAPIMMYVATRPVENHQEFQHDLENETKGFLPLTWEQIKYWNSRGAEFGSHTRTHFDCSASDPAKLYDEIVGSKEDLEERLGRPVNSFAFPFGKSENISPEAAELVAATYHFFDSSLGGENLPGFGRQHLFRKSFYSDSWELELEMQSVFDLVQKTKLALARPLSARAAAL